MSNFLTVRLSSLTPIFAGRTLIRKYRAAVSNRNEQLEAHRGLTVTLKPNLTMPWAEMCEAWDADSFPKQAPNPFMVINDGEFLLFHSILRSHTTFF